MAAACYYRSSKDRSDVSIDAQRRQLRELAEARGPAEARPRGSELIPGFESQRAVVILHRRRA